MRTFIRYLGELEHFYEYMKNQYHWKKHGHGSCYKSTQYFHMLQIATGLAQRVNQKK